MKQWQEFSGRISDRIALGNFICDADPLGLILVSGPDAGEFLQNQVSSDIALIDETRSQLSSYSTPKGRMVGIFRVVQVSNGYLLVTVKSMVLPLLQRLFHYIVQSDVKLADASDYFARIALVTDNAESLEDGSLPAEPGAVTQTDSLIAMQVERLGEQRRFLFLCLDSGQAIELWHRYGGDTGAAGFDSWRLSEIRAGIPSIYPETSESFVLQMSNLQVLGGVSFKKGCYPGQEIVARMQYLGKLKRRMFLAQIDTDSLPQPGDDLVKAGRSEADGSGTVVDAVFDSEGTCHCLFVAQIEPAETGALRLLANPEAAITNQQLPYSPPA